MHIIKAKSPTDAWLQSHQYLLENGNKDVMNESINMSVEIEDNFDTDKKFDSLKAVEADISNLTNQLGAAKGMERSAMGETIRLAETIKKNWVLK